MKNFTIKTLSVAFSLLILVMSGCGASPDSLVEDRIQIMGELVTALENDAPQAEIDSIQDRAQSVAKKYKAMDLSTAEKKALTARYRDKLALLTARLQEARMNKTMKMMEEAMKKTLNSLKKT